MRLRRFEQLSGTYSGYPMRGETSAHRPAARERKRETKMSADERILRLENAMATLAELSADREQRAARLEEIAGQHSERLQRLEDGFGVVQEVLRALLKIGEGQQRRVALAEESYVALTKLVGVTKSVLTKAANARRNCAPRRRKRSGR